mmetsp:Transcript_57243/g.139568  ORF Transcript_57243/g.139568 Transcript_57243/m.139568 type:complete len:644 (-) Transcript_57243:597-2528(-)|eukprot:CAMPEP_0113467900 /NCGR_PEP_ID=MMETSP0014_2-20120614/15060_1 /TAXON_ID=2857 /ORGANISM="Nitzschia sp." /LENGTH=643 /DNA_ID=CAMNT_0000360237 /DNA_START=1150 /DNA_END=3081 /DNA_ORIENTATION=+ /assembly_acc=CAM_ASM_000159
MKLSNSISFLIASMLARQAVAQTCGDCGSDNGSPGCTVPLCEASVCDLDPFCCDTTWDILCANQANTGLLPGCEGCFEINFPQPPGPNTFDNCPDAVQLTCDRTYAGSTIGVPDGIVPCPASSQTGNFIVDEEFLNEPRPGLWYKLSTGSDTFSVTFDTCDLSNYDTRLILYKTGPNGVGCTELETDLTCVVNNDDECSLQSVIGPGSVFEDQDYWLYVTGFSTSSEGNFLLSVECDPLAPIDPWFIQRSAFPAPEVTSTDPIEASLWLELHEDRIPDLGNVLTGEIYLPDGPTCKDGTPVDTALFAATACPEGSTLPNGSPCPEAQNEGVPVLQSLVIPDPFNFPNLFIAPSPGFNDGQFQFCVHSELVLDYERRALQDGIPDSVSFFDTYYVIEVDFTTGFQLNLATFERNPPNIGAVFDDFNADPFLCEDGNIPGTVPNSPIAEPAGSLVGESFRVCIAPEDPNLQVVSFNDVTCANDAQSRTVIASGIVPAPEVPLTGIVGTDTNGVLAFDSTVTTGFAVGGLGTPGSEGQFSCSGTVELGIARRRARQLQEAGEDVPENLTGSFNVVLTVVSPDEGLSTGAIVGIAMSGFVILVALVILYRRGCFNKKKTTTSPPKTVTTGEENSETSGSGSGNDEAL